MLFVTVFFTGVIGGILGYLLFCYILSKVVLSDDKEAALANVPFIAVKIILTLTIIFNIGIFQILIIAIISSFAWTLLRYNTKEKWYELIDEAEKIAQEWDDK